MLAHQCRVFIQVIDGAVVRKLLTDRVVNLIRKLAGLLFRAAGDHAGQVSDIDRGITQR